MFPLKQDFDLESIPDHGRFGGVRKNDIHTGVDLYCREFDDVFSIEDGIVVNICEFTGPKAGSSWWNRTQAILVEGKSGVILYGEIIPNFSLNVGDSINEGHYIGSVLTVLKKDKGLPMTMLHIELYKHGYRGDGEWWHENKPEVLLNVENLLLSL